MFLYCISCGFPVERWEIPEEEWDTAASSDRVVMCGDCTLLEYHFFNYFPELVCCDECGRPVEPEDTMEIDSLVVCIECWRPPIISGISDYAHTPASAKLARPSHQKIAQSEASWTIEKGLLRTRIWPSTKSPRRRTCP